MALRLITGRSGQGKTEYLVQEVIRLSMENPQQKYYVIVPEQFSLEMQRKMVKKHPRHGFFNIDVLSFHRLAYRIFDECGYQPGEILEDLGVSMMLRKILSEGENNFLYFKKSMKKAGFIDELKSMLMEFIGYGVTWEQVEEVSEKLGENKALSNKCKELGRIYEHFDKAIEGRFMVTEQILDVAREFAKEAPMLTNAVFYFDGFAGSVGGGGRYDEMIGKFTGTPTPATGFSIGFERIVMLLMEKGFKVPGSADKKAYLLDKKLSSAKLVEVVKKAGEERKAGKNINIVYMKKNKKFQKEQLLSEGYEIIEEIYND